MNLKGNPMLKNSYSDLRFIAGVPFGFMAETFARLAIWVSGNQLNVDFNYLGKNYSSNPGTAAPKSDAPTKT